MGPHMWGYAAMADGYPVGEGDNPWNDTITPKILVPQGTEHTNLRLI